MTSDAKDLLKQLVAFRTVNDGAEQRPGRECPEYIVQMLADLGFETEILESEGFFTAFGRIGSGEPRILYLAHFDVVPVGDAWDSDPFVLRVEGDIAYGRGTCDNKGNIVSLLLMARRLAKAPLPGTIMIAASGDEEIGGEHGAKYLKQWLQDRGLTPQYVIITDGVGQKIIFRRRNGLFATFRVKQSTAKTRGRMETIRFTTETFGSESRHSAYFRRGVDRHAFLAASKYLLLHPETVVRDVRGAFLKGNIVPEWVELDVVHPDGKEDIEYDAALTGLVRALLTISNVSFDAGPSRIGTVIWPNLFDRADEHWLIGCDIRTMTNDADAIRAAFQKSLEGVITPEIRIVSGGGYVNVDVDSQLIRAALRAMKDLPMRAELIEGAGASDSRYFARSAQVFDFGPIGANLHGPNEHVSLSSIEENAEFYYRLAGELTK